MENETLKKEIFNTSHLEESSELAREYFKDYGINMYAIRFADCSMLREFIDLEISKLLADKSYSLVPNLKMNHTISYNEQRINLYVDGSYFTKRNAITFEIDNDEFIIFCNWASGCNRIPFIVGFIKWCDWLVKRD